MPSSRHLAQARVTLSVVKRGRSVVLSRMRSRRVKKLISLVTVEMARRLVFPTMRSGNTVSYAKAGSMYAASSRMMMSPPVPFVVETCGRGF